MNPGAGTDRIFLQGLAPAIIPPEHEVFGPDWASVEQIRQSVTGWVNSWLSCEEGQRCLSQRKWEAYD